MNLRTIIYIVLELSMLCSCSSINIIKATHDKLGQLLPPGYKENIITDNCSGGKEYIFLYGDSSLIYLSSNIDYTPNYNNIIQNNDSIGRLRFQNTALIKALSNHISDIIIRPDTMEMTGTNKNGNYWREVLLDSICIGYKDISTPQKIYMDKIINEVISRRESR